MFVAVRLSLNFSVGVTIYSLDREDRVRLVERLVTVLYGS
jgi:hypothetical protein